MAGKLVENLIQAEEENQKEENTEKAVVMEELRGPEEEALVGALDPEEMFLNEAIVMVVAIAKEDSGIEVPEEEAAPEEEAVPRGEIEAEVSVAVGAEDFRKILVVIFYKNTFKL